MENERHSSRADATAGEQSRCPGAREQTSERKKREKREKRETPRIKPKFKKTSKKTSRTKRAPGTGAAWTTKTVFRA